MKTPISCRRHIPIGLALFALAAAIARAQTYTTIDFPGAVTTDATGISGAYRPRLRSTDLFADAEDAENDVQDVLDIDSSSESAQRRRSGAQLLSDQFLRTAAANFQGTVQHGDCARQGLPMPAPGHQHRLASGQRCPGKISKRSDEGVQSPPL